MGSKLSFDTIHEKLDKSLRKAPKSPNFLAYMHLVSAADVLIFDSALDLSSDTNFEGKLLN
jgi:hypothetical protein